MLNSDNLNASSEEVYIFPASFAQQRLWFLQQLEPNSSAYNIFRAIRLSGVLNVGVLERTLNEIVRRHEILRTTFSTLDGQPVQVIEDQITVGMRIVDLQSLAETRREEMVGKLARDFGSRPFDLKRGPLLRAGLLKLGDREHVALLSLHHIISDGWSTGILVKEVAVLYEAFLNDRPSSLPDLPIQYADYAIWQKEWLKESKVESLLAYWKKQLARAPLVLDLPTDRPRASVQGYRKSSETFFISKGLTDSLKTLSQRHNATLFMTLLAAFKILLARYTGKKDIIIGSPIAGRDRLETEGLIGFFVNMLVLRTDLSSDPSFEQMLDCVRETTLGALAHQDLPFERLVEELQPERSMIHTPVFQVVFALQNLPVESLELSNLKLTSVGSDTDTAKFDLTLLVSETEDGLAGTLDYNADLFESSTAIRLLMHYEEMLKEIARNSRQKLSELRLLSEAEIHQLNIEWNDTASDFPHQHSLATLFDSICQFRPDRVAVVKGDHHVTYSELDARSNQMASYLLGRGLGSEQVIGLAMTRSAELIEAMLGVLKAGCAYMPIDATYPRPRIAMMIEEAG
ncbi:MAG: condensation domain-containing protein, partial [Blastocatellia bacterium]